MKAALLEEPRRFRLIDLPEPPPPGPGEALVQIRRVGVCGTDISIYLGKFPYFEYPRIPGHELGVEVMAVGPEVAHLRPGDHCAVEPYLNDPASFASRRGRSNCCNELRVLGVHTDGGLRGRMVLPAHKLHPSARLSLEQLALVETLGIGCHAVDRAAAQADDVVVVIGAGPIGLSVLEFVKLVGARTIVLDTNARRLEFCQEALGVDQVIEVRGDDGDLAAVERATGGELATIVFDATGNAESMSRSLHFASHTGKVVFAGVVNGDIAINDPLLHRRELTLLATRNALPRDFTRIIRLIEAGKLDTRPWITHRTSLDELPDVFDGYTHADTGVLKAMVDVE